MQASQCKLRWAQSPSACSSSCRADHCQESFMLPMRQRLLPQLSRDVTAAGFRIIQGLPNLRWP